MKIRKTWSLIAFSLACAFFAGCTDDDDDDDSSGEEVRACAPFKIINGEECTSTTIPVVQLDIEVAGGRGVCTGTLISKDFIITAAHCLINAPERITVRHDNLVQDATAYGFNPLFLNDPEGDSAFDIGLVRVIGFGTTAGLTPVAIGASTDVNEGDRLSMIGFGIDEDGNLGEGLPGGNPRAAQLRVSRVDDEVIITLYDDTETNACFGDSGASAIKDGKIVGIESGGTADDCLDGDINIITSMKVESNINFITSNVPDAKIE